MLENPRSPRVRAVAKLAKKPARVESGLFLLEGPQAVAEALTFRPQLDVELYATPTALERYADIGDTAIDAGVDVEYVSEEVLNAMADTVTPQGFVAVCHQFPTAVKDVFASKPRLVASMLSAPRTSLTKARASASRRATSTSARSTSDCGAVPAA